VQTEHTLEIKKIIAGGSGLGHLADGMVVMVPLVLDGELVRVVEVKRCAGHIQAELLEVLEPSLARCRPICRHFGHCGGCNLQHARYDEQLIIKEKIIGELLARAHLSAKRAEITILASPLPTGYRHKLRLHLTRDGEVGFHRVHSNRLVAVNSCPLAVSAINDAWQALTASGLLPAIGRYCHQIEYVCSPDTSRLSVSFFLAGNRRPPTALVEKLCRLPGLAGIMVQDKKRHRNGVVFSHGTHGCRQSFAAGSVPYTLHWDRQSFFQVNPLQNERLVRLVLELVGNPAGKRVLDLFCGMGNFSIPLALAGAEVTGVEWNRQAVATGRKNAHSAGLANTRFIAADVASYLQSPAVSRQGFDVLLLDPPRQGLGRSAARLADFGSEMVVYISCDPATLMRDLRVIVRSGYCLSSITPVDMFPQTHHIECVVLLEKN